MIKHFLNLEWKSFVRSASLGSNLIIKIFAVLLALYFAAIFLILGISVFYIIKEKFNLDPLQTVNKYLIYYFALDLVVRYFFQKMPVLAIKPLLVLPIAKNTIVNYTLGKTGLSFFNLVHALFFIPFSIVLIYNHFPVVSVLLWHLSMLGLVYCNNLINILANNKDSFFYPFVAVFVGLAACHYFQLFDITSYSVYLYNAFYSTSYLFVTPLVVAFLLYKASFSLFKNQLNLDEGLLQKSEIATTENLSWLNQFGTLGTFLKNDIKLIKRNKRSKTTLMISVLFIFYGLIFFKNPAYENVPLMRLFAGIFISGGFLFTFGQFVPSWDSAYYQLMMSQNIQYKDYLSSKWWLMVITTVLTTLLASFYLYFGWQTYLLIVVGAVYNIGVNSHIVLLAGAYVKTPIDLESSKGAFGNSQAFNIKTVLLSLPKLLLPLMIYGLGYYCFSPNTGCLFVAVAGLIGFAFRNSVFSLIEKVYKTEKYATIAAYKQK